MKPCFVVSPVLASVSGMLWLQHVQTDGYLALKGFSKLFRAQPETHCQQEQSVFVDTLKDKKIY